MFPAAVTQRCYSRCIPQEYSHGDKGGCSSDRNPLVGGRKTDASLTLCIQMGSALKLLVAAEKPEAETVNNEFLGG